MLKPWPSSIHYKLTSFSNPSMPKLQYSPSLSSFSSLIKPPMAKFPSLHDLWGKSARLFTSTAVSAAESAGRTQKAVVVSRAMTSATRMKAAAKDAGACFWMKNPKTGYWAPENHFEEVDAAELRAELLPKKSIYIDIACD